MAGDILTKYIWHIYLYGKEIGDQTKDSVMTTVVVVRSLIRYLKLLINSSDIDIRNKGIQIRQKLLQDLAEYVNKRWDKFFDYGGILAFDRENEPKIRPSLRHTAWLLQLWMDIPEYFDRIEKTLEYLLIAFESYDWKEEKVATDVAIYTAFKNLLSNDEIFFSENTEIKIKSILKRIEKYIISKYDYDLNGWTSGISKVGGRQIYTLFVIAELIKFKSDICLELKNLLENNLADTFSSNKWRSQDNAGIPLLPNGRSSLSASVLASSALFRKITLSKKEKTILMILTVLLLIRLITTKIIYLRTNMHGLLVTLCSILQIIIQKC